MISRFFCAFFTILLVVNFSLAAGQEKSESSAVTKALQNYAAAVQSKNLAEIEKHVILSDDDNDWKIVHMHTSRIPRRNH